jgi:hypothetical protein
MLSKLLSKIRDRDTERQQEISMTFAGLVSDVVDAESSGLADSINENTVLERLEELGKSADEFEVARGRHAPQEGSSTVSCSACETRHSSERLVHFKHPTNGKRYHYLQGHRPNASTSILHESRQRHTYRIVG